MRAYRTENCYAVYISVFYDCMWLYRDKGKAGKLFHHGGLALTITTDHPLPLLRIAVCNPFVWVNAKRFPTRNV